MSETTDAILRFLEGKSPNEIEKTLRNLERMSAAQAEESGAIVAREAAKVESMSLADAQIKLERAIEKNDLSAIAKWAPLHKEKLARLTDKLQEDREAELAKINAPAIEARQARQAESLQEMNVLNNKIGKSDADWRRLRELDVEIKGLS